MLELFGGFGRKLWANMRPNEQGSVANPPIDLFEQLRLQPAGHDPAQDDAQNQAQPGACQEQFPKKPD
jgi:hypothetical protein